MSRPFKLNDRVEGGSDVDDYDTGRVVSVDPFRVMWDRAGAVYDEDPDDDTIRPYVAPIATCHACGAICSECVRRLKERAR